MSPLPNGSDIDRQLVRQAQGGDEPALRALVERAYPWVRRWAATWEPQPTDADDLAQDVMVRMLRKLDSYQGTARFSTWLYAVTRSQALDRLRAERRRSRERTEHGARALAGEGPPATLTGASGSDELRTVLLEAFHALPARQRAAFDLVELQGLTSSLAAERLGIEAVSVRAHLHKARRTLRRTILERHLHLISDLI